MVRGGPEERFHQGFHQGSRGFHEALRGLRGGASTKKSTACCWGYHLSLFTICSAERGDLQHFGVFSLLPCNCSHPTGFDPRDKARVLQRQWHRHHHPAGESGQPSAQHPNHHARLEAALRGQGGWLRNPFRTTSDPWESSAGWYLQGDHHFRAPEPQWCPLLNDHEKEAMYRT